MRTSQSDHIRLWAHATFWVFIFLFVFDYHLWEGNWMEATWFTVRELLTYAVVFYINFKSLVPRFLEKGKPILYLSCLFLTLLAYILSIRMSGLETILYEAEGMRNVFSMVLNCSLFLWTSTLFWYAEKMQEERERKLRLQNEKLQSELRLLRSKISPHFMFNSLNNIYALALQKHDNAAPMTAQLASMLRYALYNSAHELVLLEKEIEMTKAYFNLQRLRGLPSKRIDINVQGKSTSKKIPPMLFVNLVENAFKHSGVETHATAWLDVACIIQEEQVVFQTENSLFQKEDKEKGGLGLQYVEQVLADSFPKKHVFKKEKTDSAYSVYLELAF